MPQQNPTPQQTFPPAPTQQIPAQGGGQHQGGWSPTTAPTDTPAPSATPTPPATTAASNAVSTGLVTGSLIATAVVFTVVAWSVEAALNRAFAAKKAKKRK